MSSQLRHASTIAKKLLHSNIPSTSPHNMANFGLLTAEIGLGVCGTPAKFNGCRVLASLLQRRRSPEANQTARCLAVSCAGTLYIHFRRLLPPDAIFPRAIFTKFCVRVLPSPMLAVLVHSGRQRNFAAWYTQIGITELSQRSPPIFGWAVITLGIGPHSSIILY